MGNSAGMSVPKQGKADPRPKQNFVGITDLINKEIERIEEALQSRDAIVDYINFVHKDGTISTGPSSADDDKNITQSVIFTMDKICSSLAKIRSRLDKLQAILNKLNKAVSEQCDAMDSVDKVDIYRKVQSHLDLTRDRVADTCSRIMTSASTNPKSDGNDTNIMSDSERYQYKNEITQLKQITDNLEDELVSLKQENTDKEHNIEATNERMQKLEEKVLEERLSHEVEVNALRAVIERQEEMIKSQNRDMVTDSWLENQKNVLFSKKKDDDEISNDTCLDLIYVDQKSLPCGKNKRINTPNMSISVRNQESKENISYDTCSMASTKYVTDDDVPLPANVTEEPQSEMTNTLETPSDVILSFKQGYQSDSEVIFDKAVNNVSSLDTKSVSVTDSRKEAASTTDSSNIHTNDNNGERHKQNIQDSFENLDKNDSAVKTESCVNAVPIVEQTVENATVLKSSQHTDSEISEMDSDKKTTKQTNTRAQSTEDGAIKSDVLDKISNEILDTVTVDKTILENNSVKSERNRSSEVRKSTESTNNEKVLARDKGKQGSGNNATETSPPFDNANAMNKSGIQETTQKQTRNDDFCEDVQSRKEEDILVYEDGATKEILFKRNDGDIDGGLTYYKGVGAVIRTTVEDFGVTSVQCTVTDAVRNDMLPDLVEGERPISFFIHIKKTCGMNMTIKETESIKVFIPHRRIPAHEEATLVCSVNGQDWEQCDLILEMPASITEDIHILGTEIRGIDDVKLVAIAREKAVQIVAGEDDILYQSMADPSIKLKINTECFPARCGVTMMVHHRHVGALQTAVGIHTECRQILGCTAFVGVVCERVTAEDMYVLMKLSPGTDEECKFTLFLLEDSGWKLADCDWDKISHVLTVHLTPGMRKYRVIGLELPNAMNVEERLLAVQCLHRHTSHYSVQIVFRQKESDPSMAIILCTLTTAMEHGIAQLEKSDYCSGGPPSEPFCLQDGDILMIECTGDIAATPHKSTRMEMVFHSQKEIASKQLTLYPDVAKPRSETTKMCQGTLHVVRGPRPGFVVLAETMSMPTEIIQDSKP